MSDRIYIKGDVLKYCSTTIENKCWKSSSRAVIRSDTSSFGILEGGCELSKTVSLKQEIQVSIFGEWAKHFDESWDDFSFSTTDCALFGWPNLEVRDPQAGFGGF